MSPEKVASLKSHYPQILNDIEIDVKDGWYDIVDVLCSAIQTHVDWKTRDMDPDETDACQVVFTEVKQKFGCLRIYTKNTDEAAVRGMLNFAMSYSLRVCELCGQKGSLEREGDNVAVRCKECLK